MVFLAKLTILGVVWSSSSRRCTSFSPVGAGVAGFYGTLKGYIHRRLHFHTFNPRMDMIGRGGRDLEHGAVAVVTVSIARSER